MKYQKETMVIVAFSLGYIVKSILAPSTPPELLSALEKRVMKDPVKYEQVIDNARESLDNMKVLANNYPTKEGHVPFKDLQLVLWHEADADLTYLLNKTTEEILPVMYVDGRTAAGTYGQRLCSVRDETLQEGKEKTKDLYEKVKGWFSSGYSNGSGEQHKFRKDANDYSQDISAEVNEPNTAKQSWIRQKSYSAWNWLKNGGAEPKWKVKAEDKISGISSKEDPNDIEKKK